MVKNLITGIGGFVASHLADLLLDKGEETYGTYRWSEDLGKAEHLRHDPNFKAIAMDLNDEGSCFKQLKEIKPDYIFHLAAQSYVPDSFDYPVETIRTNMMGTLNLLEAVRYFKEKEEYDPLIHICSTSEVYGLVKEEDLPITEKQQLNPSNPYAVGKLGGDMAALTYYTNFGVKSIRTRAFTHTGPRRTMMSAESNFAKQIARIEKDLQEPVIRHGNLDSVRTWTDVRDMVKAYYVLLRKCQPGEVYNISGDVTKTIGEMMDHLISLSPIKNEIKKELDPGLLRPYDVTLQISDCSKFKNETGWKPEIPFQQTMKDLLDWWRQHTLKNED